MGRKKILCCLAVLLKLTRTDGTVKEIPRLRNWSEKIIEFVKTYDNEVTPIEVANGKKGLIAIAEGISDAMGRLSVFPEVDVPENIFNGWSKAADAVIHGKDKD